MEIYCDYLIPEDFLWLKKNIYIKSLHINQIKKFYTKFILNSDIIGENISLKWITCPNYNLIKKCLKANSKLNLKNFKCNHKLFRQGIYEKTFESRNNNIKFMRIFEQYFENLKGNPMTEHFYVYWILRKYFPLDIIRLILQDRLWILTSDLKKNYYISLNLIKKWKSSNINKLKKNIDFKKNSN